MSWSARLVLSVLQELRELGKIVILVAHDSRFIAFADRVYTVNNGGIEEESAIAVYKDRTEGEDVQQVAEVVHGGPEADFAEAVRAAGIVPHQKEICCR
jgi:ABC-type multidrug transport system ATPase subunit